MRTKSLSVYLVAALVQSRALGLRHTTQILKLACSMALVSLVGTGVAGAKPLAAAVEGQGKNKDAKRELVFVTGSRIPKRVQVKAIGTNAVEPLRVYTRAEIDRTGRFTTAGILAQDLRSRSGSRWFPKAALVRRETQGQALRSPQSDRRSGDLQSCNQRLGL